MSATPAPDPTANVLDLVRAESRRQDDLREAEARHTREIVKLRAQYDAELRTAEANRIDAIRAVDVQAVQRAADVATVVAETLRSQVATTAEAARQALETTVRPILATIGDLQRAQYETQGGKSQIVESRSDRRGNVNTTIAATAVLFSLFSVIVGTLIALHL